MIETLKTATNFETKQILYQKTDEDENHTFLKPSLRKPIQNQTPVQSNGKIWSFYKSRYSTKVLPETILRKMSLKETRDIILDTYVTYYKEYRLMRKDVKSIQDVLFEVLEQTFILQELVHKVSFEFLTACEEYRTKHAVSIIRSSFHKQ